MAFPSIAATATTNGSTAATNKVCNLPTGIVSGDRLVLILRSAGADIHSTPVGWSALDLNNGTDTSNDITSIFARDADGTEGATVTINGTASLKFAVISWRITGADVVANIQFAAAIGTSASPDPPSLSPTGGAKDYLWLWVGGWEGEQTSPPASNPANYTLNVVGADSGAGGAVATNCRVAGAARQLNAATEDPGVWTISVSDDWTATVVAIPPTAPLSPTRGRVSWAEAEAPFVSTRGRISWGEGEVPLAPTRGLMSFAEGETPFAPTRGLISWGEQEVPSVLSPTRGLVSWAEAETPFVATRGRVSWVEAEAPLAPTRGRMAWTEMEVPFVGTRGQVSWAEEELPFVLTRGLISWAEGEVPAVGAGGGSASQAQMYRAGHARRRRTGGRA